MTLLSEKHDELKHAIEDLFATKPDWVKFYREVMGLHGLVRRAFPTVGGNGRIRTDRDLSADPPHGNGVCEKTPHRKIWKRGDKVHHHSNSGKS